MNRKLTASSPRGKSSDYRVVKIRTEGRSATFTRKIFIALLILLQITALLILYFRFLLAFRYYFIISFVLSLVCCINLLSTDKDGQTKAGWIFFLLLCSSFGFIAYALSLESVFYRRSGKRYEKILSRTEKYSPAGIPVRAAPENLRGDLEYLKNSGGFTAFAGGGVKYFPSGARLFDDLTDVLQSAEKFIFMEYFIIADGVLLTRIKDILLKKAAEGVDVRIIADSMGSRGLLSYRTVRRLRKGGVKICSYNKLLPLFTFAINLRDHRKICVVDGKTAYTGGCNLADEYINEKRMHGYWKDVGLRLDGAAVDRMTFIFLRQWQFCTRKEEDYSPYLNLYASSLALSESEKLSVVVPYADGKDYKSGAAKGVYSNIIAGAKEKLYAMTPYLVPDDETMSALAAKARSGVDVRLVIPGVPDKSYVYMITLFNARKLQRSGVKVYAMQHAFVHAKVMLSENCAAVGSANIDLRSFYNQFEDGVYFNGEVMRDVEADFEKTFRLSREGVAEKRIYRSFFYRLAIGFVKLFSPLM